MTKARQRVLAALIGAATVLFVAFPASAQSVQPIPNDGFMSMTARVCGTTDGWLQNAQRNGAGTGLHWAYLNRTYDIQCVGAAQPARQPVPKKAPPQQQNVSGWVNPVPGACAGSGFGWRGGRIHNGVDLGAGYGTPIHAAHAGTVHYGYQASGAGMYIVLDHGNGLWTTYYHMSSRSVPNGSYVQTNQVIGHVGATGNATGPHLHFEVHPWGEWVQHWSSSLGANAYVNPVSWMANNGVHLGC